MHRAMCHMITDTLRTDVCITYTALDADSSGRARMDDLVEYRKQSARSDTAPSTGNHTSLQGAI